MKEKFEPKLIWHHRLWSCLSCPVQGGTGGIKEGHGMSSQLSCAPLPAGARGRNESRKVQRELGGGREGKGIERRGLGEKTKGELEERRKK